MDGQLQVPPSISSDAEEGPLDDQLNNDRAQSSKDHLNPSTHLPERPDRPKSPILIGNISMDFIIHNQMTRYGLLNQMYDEVCHINRQTVLAGDLQTHIQNAKLIWERFDQDHDKLGMVTKKAIFSHPYMVENIYHTTFSTYHQLVKLARHMLDSLPTQPTTQPPTQPSQTTQPRKLPEIAIPSFSGQYEDWTSFRDLFSSMVIENTQITDVERMHYLRSSLKGHAAQVVSTLPCDGDSFRSAWDILSKRYNNKRLLISSWLDRLIGDNATIKCTSHDLSSFLNSFTESLNALVVLNVDILHWDPILVHLITKRLDRTLLEKWENSLGSSTEFPKLPKLTDFLWDRARAQERLDALKKTTQSSTQSSSQPSTSKTLPQRPKPSSFTHATTTQKSNFECDMCGKPHFIVTCPQFAQLTPQQRMNQIVKAQLCYNCMGRHNVRSCQSSKRCKTCNSRHHTMLHGSNPASSTQQ